MFADSVGYSDWGSLNGAFWGATQTDIKLTGDCKVAKDIPLTVATGKAITFDLNGYTLDGDGERDAVLINIPETSTLYIIDSSAAKTGKITNALSCGAIYNRGNLTIEDGVTITGNSSNGCGGGIYNETVGKIFIDGATISGNTAKEQGGGIYNKGQLTILDGTVSANTAENGGGIGNAWGTLTVKGGSISNNKANNRGGGIFNNGSNATTNITGGEIIGNTSAKQGCAIYNDSSTLNIYGGEITGNSTEFEWTAAIHTSGSLNIYNSSPITIKDNTAKGAEKNVNIDGYTTFKVEGLNSDSSIGITLYPTVSDVGNPITFLTDSAISSNLYSCFFSDEYKYVVDATTGQMRNANFYTVSFDVNGQGTTPAAIKNVKESTCITAPTAPTATGYTFVGWYKDAACTDAWDFDTDKVIADTTLYAKWDLNQYTVSFNAQGHGTAPAAQTVSHGAVVSQPNDLTASGYNFGGWYKEAACTSKWDFDTDKVTADTTLYAKWTQVIYYYYEEPAVNTDDEKTEDKTAEEEQAEDKTAEEEQKAEDKTAEEEKPAETEAQTNEYFDDVEADAYYSNELSEAAELGVTNGTGPKQFSGKSLLTRAQLATFLWRIEGRPAVSSETLMLDVEDGSWYEDAAQWADYVGILSKDEYNCFRPDENITREEFAKILYACAQSKGLGFKGTYSYTLDNPDAAQVSSGCSEAVQWVVENNIFYLDSKRYLMPQEYITRADALYSIMKLYELL